MKASPFLWLSRLANRALGSGPAIPRDALRGCTPSELRDVTELTLREAAALQTPNMAALTDLTLDTSALAAPNSTDALFHLLPAGPC